MRMWSYGTVSSRAALLALFIVFVYCLLPSLGLLLDIFVSYCCYIFRHGRFDHVVGMTMKTLQLIFFAPFYW